MPIVKLNISVTNPPKPSKLLQSGVIVSAGGSTIAAGKTQLVTSLDEANKYVIQEQEMSSIQWADGVVTVSFAEPLPNAYGQKVSVEIKGVTPSAYNGTYDATIVAESNQLTFDLQTDPGTATVMGTALSLTAQELQKRVTSFFAQGKARAVYVLELGQMTTDNAIAALFSFIDSDIAGGIPYQTFFSYLVPTGWADVESFLAGTGRYTSEQDLIYFFVSVTNYNYEMWAQSGNKSVVAVVVPDSNPSGNVPAANVFQSALSNDPGSSNMVPPMAYRFIYGADAYPQAGNAAKLIELDEKNISYIGLAAEGGLSNKMLVKGHCLDGNPFGYWYAIAWAAVNLTLALANEVINGSNTTLNPLYYDQRGIERLQRRALQTLRSGVSYGLLLGTVQGVGIDQAEFTEKLEKGEFAGNAVINAIPFSTYSSLNPNDYAAGVYAGLSAVITPRRGFESITFNLNVTNFVGA